MSVGCFEGFYDLNKEDIHILLIYCDYSDALYDFSRPLHARKELSSIKINVHTHAIVERILLTIINRDR